DSIAVQQIYTLTTQAENNAAAAEAALKEAHDAAEQLRAKPQSAANDSLLKELDAIAPPSANGAGPGAAGGRGRGGGRGGRGGRGGGGAAPAAPAGGAGAGAPGTAPETAVPGPTLASIGPALVAAVMPLQSSEMPPTAATLKTIQDRQAEFTT